MIYEIQHFLTFKTVTSSMYSLTEVGSHIWGKSSLLDLRVNNRFLVGGLGPGGTYGAGGVGDASGDDVGVCVAWRVWAGGWSWPPPCQLQEAS